MRLGIALDFGSTEPVRPQIDGALRLLEAAEANGLTSAWLGESYHEHPEVFHLPAALTVLGHLAGRTDLALGTAVLLARAYAPRRLAYEAALVDQLCGGRLTLGIALGNADVAERLGTGTAGQPPGRWLESVIELLRAAWKAEPGSSGRGAVVPPPIQRNGPALLVGGRTATAARRAAHFGDGYFAATNYRDALLAQNAATYWATRGHATGEVAVTRLCLIASETGVARELAATYFATLMSYYTDRAAWHDASGPGEPELPLVGSPSDVVAALRRYATAGVTSVQLRVAPFGTPPEVSRRTLQFVGSTVMPELNEM